mgnify:FL=1
MYPKWGGTFITLKDFIEMRLKKATEDYRTLFDPSPTSEDLAKYLSRLDVYHRELFLDVADFYGIMYNERNAFPPYLEPAIVLTMMFSIIERMQRGENKYIDLDDWLRSKECKSQLRNLAIEGQTDADKVSDGIHKLLEKYREDYGSVSAATDFFSEYFTKQDKQKLVRCYNERKNYVTGIFEGNLRITAPDLLKNPTDVKKASQVLKNTPLEEGYLPPCYDIRCYIHHGSCRPELGCRLSDDRVLKENLTKVVKQFIYVYRNEFVHDAQLVMLARNQGLVGDVIKGKGVIHELSLKQLLESFRTAVKSFFDKNLNRDIQ